MTKRSRAMVYDPSFGPELVIEDIEVIGNASTATRIILRALPIAKGEALRAGDPRFQQARFRLLSTGYFRNVALGLRKGNQRGHVILTVTVEERGTIALNNLLFGTSASSPWWFGMDATERNLVGTGFALGAGFVYAQAGDVPGATPQWAAEVRIADPSILGTRTGAHVTLLHTRASEPYRVEGSPDDSVASNFAALFYRRTSGRVGAGFEVTPLAHLSVDVRVDQIESEPPVEPIQTLPDGAEVPVVTNLNAGRSFVVGVQVGFDHDTRPDPVLPYRGNRLVVLSEAAAKWMGSSYDFVTIRARYGHWWPLRSKIHVLSLHLRAGLVVGNAPRFDRLHVADFNRLLTPRAFDLVVSTPQSRDIFDTGSDELNYGQLGGSIAVEYSYQLFRGQRHIFGGDLFLGFGLWGMSETLAGADAATSRPRALATGLDLDVLVDAGLRVDTEIGIFEFSFANALGRLPF